MLSVSLSRLVVDCTVLFLEGSATIRANFEFQDCYLQHSRILPLCFGSLRFLLLSLDTVIGRQYDLLLNYCIKTEHLHEHDCFRLALVDQHQTAPIERSAAIDQTRVLPVPLCSSTLCVSCCVQHSHTDRFVMHLQIHMYLYMYLPEIACD